MKALQIRSLRAPYPLVQTVGLRDVHLLLQSNNSLITTLSNAVYGLLPVPLIAQVCLIYLIIKFHIPGWSSAQYISFMDLEQESLFS